MPAYVPPHKRGQKNEKKEVQSSPQNTKKDSSPPPSRPPRSQGPRERDVSETNAREREHVPRTNNYNRSSGTPQKTGSSRFGNIFDNDDRGRGSGYSGYDNNRGNSRRNGNNSYGSGYSSGYSSYGNSSRISRRAQIELSTTPNAQLEKELFGDSTNTVSAGINFDHYNEIPVEVSGNDCPPGLETFQESPLHEALLANINRCGYVVPTPVQKFSVPIVTQRRDLMACAQTGSGKTAAFLLPMIHNLLTNPAPDIVAKSRSKSYPRALILSPTRELAQQIQVQARKFLYCTGLRSVCVYGGSPIGQQFKDLQDGVDLVVATPGRLWDMIERGRMSLSQCEFLTLDEADRMLDMGFEPQIRNIVDGADLMPAGERNTLMYSATFPTDIQQLAQDFLQDYIFLAVGRVGSTSDFITQKVLYCEKHDKMAQLFELLEKNEGLKLVFTATKRDADRVEYLLNEEGMKALAIHGDKGQREREYALRRFKDGHVDILVATDVASRGLDIPNVLFVIQYDLPNTIDDYVHRIGRTGRCGNPGTAISLVNYNNAPILSDLRDLLTEGNQDCPTWLNELCHSCRGKKKKKGRYGGRDYRNNKKSSYNGRSNGRSNNDSWGRNKRSGGNRDRDSAW